MTTSAYVYSGDSAEAHANSLNCSVGSKSEFSGYLEMGPVLQTFLFIYLFILVFLFENTKIILGSYTHKNTNRNEF